MSAPFLLLTPTLDPCGETPTCFTSGGCVLLRSLSAYLTGGGDTTNIVHWVNSYDITTVAWGNVHTGVFSDPSQTTPYYVSDTGCVPGICNPTNQLLCVGGPDEDGNCTTGPCGTAVVSRSQYLLLSPTAYYVIAYGNSISAAPSDERACGEGGNWFALGCIYPLQGPADYPLLVDLPIPDNTLDDTILVQNYYLGLIQPGATIPGVGVLSGEITTLPDLSSLTVSLAGVSGFGVNWAGSLSTSCYGPADDPFTGSDPP